MKIFIICVATFVVSIGNLYGFEKNDSNEVNGDILKKKPISFQFAIGSFLNVTNFDNLNFSAKKNFSKNFALRLGAGFNFSKADLNGTTNDYVSENDRNRFTAALDMIYYFNPEEEIKAYGGVGPYYNFSHSSFKRERVYGSSPYYYYNYSRVISIGANALVGVEWFVTKKISMLAEYNFAFTYSDVRQITDYHDEYDIDYQDISGNETDISGKQLKFGLSVYF